MNSILNNSAALSALQSLQMTQQALGTTQQQVSTGLAVGAAKDNASYWSIAEQLKANGGIATAANTTLAQSQAAFDTANSAIKSVITTINSIQSTLTQATNPGADINSINTTLASLSKQLTDAISGASFNGVNLLDGSTTTSNFVSGYNASTGAVNTIGFTASALTGGTTAGTPVTTQLGTITDAKQVASLNAIIAQVGGGNTTADNGITVAAAGVTPTATNVQFGSNRVAITAGTPGAGAAVDTSTQITITSMDQAGNLTVTTYSAVDANGAALASDGSSATLGVGSTTTTAGTTGGASGFVAVSTTTPATANSLLTQNGTSLNQLGTGGTTVAAGGGNAQTLLGAATAALKAVTSYAASIGATQTRMSAASAFNSALTTNYANGVSALVDADMNTASTRLQALQTQQQLGIQSLSIANQNAQLILKLFP